MRHDVPVGDRNMQAIAVIDRQLAYHKNDHYYVFRWSSDRDLGQVLRMVVNMVYTSKREFDYYDAAVVTRAIRQLTC